MELYRCSFVAFAAIGIASAAPAAPKAPASLLIADTTLIDGTGAPPRTHVDVRIADGRIAAITPASGRPAGGKGVVDGRGRYLLPGFFDSNAHLTVYGQPSRRDTSAKYGDRNEELALEVAQRSLKAGVTTLIDSYGVLPPSIVVRDRIDRGEAVGSRLLLAGNIVGWGGTFSLTFSLTKESDLSYFQEKWNDLMAQDVGEETMDMTPDELRSALEAAAPQDAVAAATLAARTRAAAQALPARAVELAAGAPSARAAQARVLVGRLDELAASALLDAAPADASTEVWMVATAAAAIVGRARCPGGGARRARRCSGSGLGDRPNQPGRRLGPRCLLVVRAWPSAQRTAAFGVRGRAPATGWKRSAL